MKRCGRLSCLALVLVLTCLMLACGSSTTTTVESPSNTTPAVVSIKISPYFTAVPLGNTQTSQFTATVTGTSNTAVTWSVNGIAGGNSSVGTIDTNGVFTAPNPQASPSPGVPPPGQVVTVTATSAADSTKSASANTILISQGQVSATQNPLVAQYSFNSPVPYTMQVQFGPTTSYGLQTWSRPGPSGGGVQNMLIAGMMANTVYHMRATIQLGGGLQYVDPDLTFTTGAISAAIPTITVPVPVGPQTNPGIELLDLDNIAGPPPILAAATDLAGNIIWYYQFDTTGGGIAFPIKPLPNGHMKIAIGSATPTASPQPLNVVREIDLAGNTISELTLPQLNAALVAAGSTIIASGFHHDFLDLPNGHTIYIVYDIRNETGLTGYPGTIAVIGDALIDVDTSGNVAWTWSTFDHLDINYHPFPGQFPDWTHSNAIVYSPTDGDLVLSCRNISYVIKIDYDNGQGTGDILWEMGPNGDFTLTNGTPSDLNYNQHYPVFLSTNTSGTFTLGLWDNGNTRPDPNTGLPCGSTGAAACYSSGEIYNVDEEAKTLSVQWQDSLSVFALCCGNINVLANGDVEMGAGGDSFYPGFTEVLEVTQDAAEQVVWQLEVNGAFSYRMFRIPSLYPGVQW